MPATISKDRWLAALKDIDTVQTSDDPSALTVYELAELWKCGRSVAETRVHRLLDLKKAIRVRVRRQRAGRMSTLNGYLLTK